MSKAQRIIAGLAALLLAHVADGVLERRLGRHGERPADQQIRFRHTSSKASPGATQHVLQQMVQEALLEQYAKNNNITVSDAEIDQARKRAQGKLSRRLVG